MNMTKKAGQPESALEMTAGRRLLLRMFESGVADGEQMAMAANWLRDLDRHFNLRDEELCLSGHSVYNLLMGRSCFNTDDQRTVALWIRRLLNEDLSDAEIIMSNTNEPKKANDVQVGGDHYRSRKIQHWDFVISHGYSYLPGQITKYLSRWRDKNGAQDVEKASHFLDKLIESRAVPQMEIDLGLFLGQFPEMTDDERTIFAMVHAYTETGNLLYLQIAREHMGRVLALAQSA